MKNYVITDKFIFRNILNSNVLVPAGEEMFESNVLVELNETAAFVYSSLKTPKNIDGLVDLFLDEYETDRETLLRDIPTALESLISVGAVKEI